MLLFFFPWFHYTKKAIESTQPLKMGATKIWVVNTGQTLYPQYTLMAWKGEGGVVARHDTNHIMLSCVDGLENSGPTPYSQYTLKA